MQYELSLTALGNSFLRTRDLAKHVENRDPPDYHKEAKWAAAMAKAAPHELEMAIFMAARLKSRRAAAATAFSTLWLCLQAAVQYSITIT